MSVSGVTRTGAAALRAVARGDRAADVVVRGARVFVPELTAYVDGDVLVCGDRVADVVADGSDSVGPETTVVEAAGGVVVPGFIDVHTHLDTFQAFEQSYVHALAGGTTTVVSETERFAKRLGVEGIRGFLDATADLPMNVFATLPPSPFYEDVAGADARTADRDAIVALADEDRVVGVGEVFWNRVIGGGDDAPIESLLEAVRAAGGVVCGHGAGCRGDRLSAFATLVDNDHEVLSPEDVPERLRRGITPIGRYGSIRDDIDAFAAGVADADAGGACLCSDGMWPAELLDEGYMDRVVRRAIEAGTEPTTAFRMATLDAARAFGLDGLGSFAPGSRADIVVLSDEKRVTVETVVSGGELVVRDGEPTVAYRPFDYPERWYETVHVGGGVEADRFRVPADDCGTVRAIEYTEGLLSAETRFEPPVEDGAYVARDGVAKAALLPSRRDAEDPGFTGFVTGLGLREGAVATSDTWGHDAVLVVGADEASMARATERVAELGGGWVVVRAGSVAAELPTPIAGVCSADPVETTRRRGDDVRAALARQGVEADQPLLAVGTLTAVGMPWFKLGAEGYVDVLENEVVGLRPGDAEEPNV